MLKSVGLALCVAAAGLVGKKPIDTQHFLIHGNVYEIDPVQNAQYDANDTRVIVYKDGEIYVAFNTNDDGKYLFNLPIGENYTLEFGGDTYINKRITMDASTSVFSAGTRAWITGSWTLQWPSSNTAWPRALRPTKCIPNKCHARPHRCATPFARCTSEASDIVLN